MWHADGDDQPKNKAQRVLSMKQIFLFLLSLSI